MTHSESLRHDASGPGVECVDGDLRCFTVRQDDSSRKVTDPCAACTHIAQAEGTAAGSLVTALDAPTTSEEAMRLAVKLAVDEGAYERAAALLGVLRQAH